MDDPRVRNELAMTVLEDLQLALSNVMRDVFPTFDAKVTIVTAPRVGVFIELAGTDPRYPRFVEGHVVVRPVGDRRLLFDGGPSVG